MAERLEQEYLGAVATGQWQCKVVLTSGDWVMLHSPEVMMHFPVAAALAGSVSAAASDHWAVLVAGSNTYSNYRHQADVAHAY